MLVLTANGRTTQTWVDQKYVGDVKETKIKAQEIDGCTGLRYFNEKRADRDIGIMYCRKREGYKEDVWFQQRGLPSADGEKTSSNRCPME